MKRMKHRPGQCFKLPAQHGGRAAMGLKWLADAFGLARQSRAPAKFKPSFPGLLYAKSEAGFGRNLLPASVRGLLGLTYQP
jgi:hypothetical protein